MRTYTGTVRRAVNAFKAVLVEGLVRTGATPDLITFAGFLFACGGGLAFAAGRFPLGGLMILLAGACDVLDGAVAQRSGRGTPFGAFFDSCLDRYSDIVLLGGVALHYAARGPRRNVALALLAIAGSTLVSYARARAEALGISCKVGFWERAERTFMIMLGGFFWRMPGVLWELAILANITAAHRIYHVWRRVRRPSWDLPYVPVLSDILFWEHPRYTWQYDVYVGLGIALPLLLPIR
ncbi:MAG: CDP-alcohol phosphatidyltransferase family protein [bacterium]|nr:CDP-alcohol phosphatidyltransferase family protein [bacterium]